MQGFEINPYMEQRHIGENIHRPYAQDAKVKTFSAPHYFSWKPCDQKKGGGRKLMLVCVVCVHVWDTLYLYLPLSETFPLSVFGSLLQIFLYFCCWHSFSGVLAFLFSLSGPVFSVSVLFVDLLLSRMFCTINTFYHLQANWGANDF